MVKMKSGMRGICAAVLAVFAAFGVSCSRAEPRIVFGFIALAYFEEPGGPREQFSFFVIPEDDDGFENIADLFLYHDREQLRWHFSRDDWATHESDGRTWIGSHSIAMVGHETLPRGQFRAVLVNRGGERSERNFTFDAPESPRFPFPTVAVSDGSFTVVSQYPTNRLVAHDAQGNFLGTAEISVPAGPLAELALPVNTRFVALWAQDSEHFTSAFTDVVPID